MCKLTNLSTEFCDDDRALTLCADVMFDDTFGEFDVKIMLLFICDDVKLLLWLLLLILLASGTDVTVTTLVDAAAAAAADVGGVVGVTGGIWFKYSPLPIMKTVDCESPPSSLADESSRAYLP